MKKRDVFIDLRDLDMQYVHEIEETAEEAMEYLNSALCDFVDSVNHKKRDLIRNNMLNNIEDAVHTLESLRDLLTDEQQLQELDNQMLLEKLKN